MTAELQPSDDDARRRVLYAELLADAIRFGVEEELTHEVICRAVEIKMNRQPVDEEAQARQAEYQRRSRKRKLREEGGKYQWRHV